MELTSNAGGRVKYELVPPSPSRSPAANHKRAHGVLVEQLQRDDDDFVGLPLFMPPPSSSFSERQRPRPGSFFWARVTVETIVLAFVGLVSFGLALTSTFLFEAPVETFADEASRCAMILCSVAGPAIVAWSIASGWSMIRRDQCLRGERRLVVPPAIWIGLVVAVYVVVSVFEAVGWVERKMESGEGSGDGG